MEYALSSMDNGETVITLSGIINEDAEFAFERLKSEMVDKTLVTFNFSAVKSINSLGVRAWVTFLRSIEEGRKVSFAECTPDVIMQINMIPSFQDKAQIKSFYTNYVCENKGVTEKVLIETSQLPAKSIPEPRKCEGCDCDGFMETEELEEEYFAFLLR